MVAIELKEMFSYLYSSQLLILKHVSIAHESQIRVLYKFVNICIADETFFNNQTNFAYVYIAWTYSSDAREDFDQMQLILKDT